MKLSKVLITESVHDIGPELLRQAGCRLVFADRDMEVIRREIVDADGVIVRILPLPRTLLETGKRLKIVSKHGVGVDNIDLDYCREAGVAVTVTPDANGQAVAEHASALMMALAKHLIPVSRAYRETGFGAKNSPPCMELSGKTAGVVGLGRIGKRFADMCRLGFGMEVLAYDPYLREAPQGVELVSGLEELLKRCDVVSLHCALAENTRGMIGRDQLAAMKPGAILINCARGPLVEGEALIEALRSGRLGGAGLDVTDPEPLPPDSPLFQMENVIVTPHFAPSTRESAQRMSRIAAENVIACLSGREPAGRLV